MESDRKLSTLERLGRVAAAAILTEPLSDSTRRTRNQSILLSVVSILAFSFGVSPKNFNLLGLTFENPDIRLLNRILAIGSCLVFVEFIVLATIEGLSHAMRILDAINATEDLPTEDAQEIARRWRRNWALPEIGRWKGVTLFLRGLKFILDVAAPVVAFVVAMIAYASARHPG